MGGVILNSPNQQTPDVINLEGASFVVLDGFVIQDAERAGIRVVEPSEIAEQSWLETITASNAVRSSFQSECTPGYYNNEGRPGEGPGWFGGNYGGGAQAFFAILRDWRAADDLAGLETT